MSSTLLLLALLGTQVPGADTSTIDLVVFRDGAAVAGLEVRVGETSAGTTDDYGSLTLVIPSGRAPLVLWEGGVERAAIDLLTDAKEVVQVIVTLNDEGPPTLAFESSAGRSPLNDPRRSVPEARPKEADLPPGAVVGVVISVEDRAPVVGAQIYFSGTDRKVETDDAGRYEAEVPAGVYAMSVIHPRFDTQTIPNVRVISAKAITANIELTPTGIALQDYVVTAPYVEGSIASVIEAQRQTSNVTEVLGAEQMSASGDSNAAEALQRVTGLTVEQGKFVLVRGQPSRYTLTLWNGSPLPSPEPLKRVVPLDLFPTGVLSGIEVQKSYSAELPGSFGAGLIDLQTRGVRDEPFLELNLSTGMNSVSAFQTGLDYEGGSFDVFGFDDGTRALPSEVNRATQGGDLSLENLPDDARNALGRSFTNIYTADDKTLPPDFGLTVAGGSQFELPEEGTLGFVASLQWTNQWRRQERIQRSFSLMGDDRLVRQNDFLEERTDFDASLGALLTVEAKWESTNIRSNTFYVHQTQQRTERTTGTSRVSEEVDIQSFLLSWIERDLLAQQLIGQHDLGFVLLEWRGLAARADRDAPDRREYDYAKSPDQDQFFARGNSGMNRRYNGVQDLVLNGGLDLKFPILAAKQDWLKLSASVGGAFDLTDREALTQLFRWRPDDETPVDRSETNAEILYDPAQSGVLLDFRDQSFVGSDDYTGTADIFGVYALAEARFGEALRLLSGARLESAAVEVLTFQAASDAGEPQSGGFDTLDVLPFVSATWFVLDDLQARAAYGRTLSRPMFNELSPATFFDPDSGEQFIGNPDLRPTQIDGADLRLEWYPSGTESAAIGGFLKLYDDPIERTFVQRAGTVSVGTFQNADEATVLGLETGGRIDLGRLKDIADVLSFFDDFFLQANIAVMTSQVTLSDQGSATRKERPLDGQAVYVFNLQTGYNGEDHDVVLAFNQVGRRLHRAGVLGQPDVFREAVPRLDLTWTWRIWEDGTLRVSGSNLLNPSVTLTQGGEVWRQFEEGLSVGASFKLAL